MNVLNIADGISRLQAVMLLVVGAGLYFYGGQIFDPEGEARRAKIEQAAYESTYQELCPSYLNMSFAERLTSTRRWCENYRDQLAEVIAAKPAAAQPPERADDTSYSNWLDQAK